MVIWSIYTARMDAGGLSGLDMRIGSSRIQRRAVCTRLIAHAGPHYTTPIALCTLLSNHARCTLRPLTTIQYLVFIYCSSSYLSLLAFFWVGMILRDTLSVDRRFPDRVRRCLC